MGRRRGFVVACAVVCLAGAVIARQSAPPGKGDPEAAKLKNPVAATPESIAAGQKTYQSLCAGCHGKDAKGGLIISVIEDQGGTQPPDLTDDKWDHGSSDGEIFTIVKKGVPPAFFMAPWDGRVKDEEIWNVVNYLKSLAQKSTEKAPPARARRAAAERERAGVEPREQEEAPAARARRAAAERERAGVGPREH